MTLNLRFILLLLFLCCKSSAFSESTQLFLTNLKSEKSKDKIAKVLSKRLEFEYNRHEPNFDMIMGCLYEIHVISKTHYSESFQKLINYLQTQLNKKEIGKTGIPSFVVEYARTVSTDDALELFKIFYNKEPQILVDLFPILLTEKKTQLLTSFFENKLIGGIKNLNSNRNVVESYCLSLQLNGGSEKCINLLLPYQPKSLMPWAKLTLANAYLAIANLPQAQQFLMEVLNGDSDCSKKVENPWAYLFMSQLWRVKTKLKESNVCLEKFRSNIDDESSIFYYNLEKTKNARFDSVSDSNRYLLLAEAYVEKNFKEGSFFEFLTLFEKLKNNYLAENQAALKKIFVDLHEQTPPNALTPYSEAIETFQEFIKKNQILGDKSQFATNFESLDLYVMLQSKNRSQ